MIDVFKYYRKILSQNQFNVNKYELELTDKKNINNMIQQLKQLESTIHFTRRPIYIGAVQENLTKCIKAVSQSDKPSMIISLIKISIMHLTEPQLPYHFKVEYHFCYQYLVFARFDFILLLFFKKKQKKKTKKLTVL